MAPVSFPQYQPPLHAVARKENAPTIIIMVGEQGRQRSCLAHNLRRYLIWTQHQAKVFSYRSDRRSISNERPYYSSQQINSPKQVQRLDALNYQVLHEARSWILAQDDNSFAIIDGNYSTAVAKEVLSNFFEQVNAKVLFIEFVAPSVDAINNNILDLLNGHEDYSRMGLKEDDIRKILEDFRNSQITLSTWKKNQSYIRYMNDGENVVLHNFFGFQKTGILDFVSNYKSLPNAIYFSRHGESEYNLLGRIGGNAILTERGQKYSKAIARYFNEEHRHRDLQVWTSTKIRTKQTAQFLQATKTIVPEIDEIDAGVCEGLTYEEVAELYPKEMAKRDIDKLGYRYPQGESYLDLMQRLKRVLMEVQTSDKPLLVISHQAVLRPILAYFNPPENLDEIPYINVPLHTIIKLTPREYDWNVEYINFNIECVNTHRKKPMNCSIDRTNEDALSTVPAHINAIT